LASHRGNSFAPALKGGLYEAIFRRRDIRRFTPEAVADDALARVLIAAHHAPSVGFTQPWDFIVVRDLERRARVHATFQRHRASNAAQFTAARRAKFLSLKLEGILDAPVNLIVTCTPGRFGAAVLGKTSMRRVEEYSTCLAIANLWLAARSEGLGVGWVSIMSAAALRRIFEIPRNVIPVAYLCIGHAENFPRRPMLETVRWQRRLLPASIVHFESWRGRTRDRGLTRALTDASIWSGIREKSGS
jgi:5,6-dimethylbenzimidazole synthase